MIQHTIRPVRLIDRVDVLEAARVEARGASCESCRKVARRILAEWFAESEDSWLFWGVLSVDNR